MERKNFIHKNDSFVCEKCGDNNPPADGTCRNHCRNCLHSLHVDDEVPGDRASLCNGLMPAIDIDYVSKKGYMLVHECQKCGKKMRNMLAEDDNLHEFEKLSQCTTRFNTG